MADPREAGRYGGTDGILVRRRVELAVAGRSRVGEIGMEGEESETLKNVGDRQVHTVHLRQVEKRLGVQSVVFDDVNRPPHVVDEHPTATVAGVGQDVCVGSGGAAGIGVG